MKVTIIGGGFAGVKTALELAKDPTVHVSIITDRPDFQYYPSLYSSATGHSHLESWVPLGEIFGGHTNIHVYLDRIIGIDADKKVLHGASERTYDYKTLVIAVGVVTTYFGIAGLDQYSYGIKSAEEIRRLKQRIHDDLVGEGKLDKNYVVIGGGPTGVELAAALGTYLERLCTYHGVKRHHTTIRLIEAAPRLLPRSHPSTSKRVKRRLEKLGVEVQVDTKVEKETATQIIASGRPIQTHTVIWTSGVTNNPLFAAHPAIFQLAPNGRVIVDKQMRAHKDIYVLGDNAATPYTGLAQTALHDAIYVARNLLRQKQGQSMHDYKAVRPASAIPVGTRWAVFELGWFRLYSWPAAIIRRVADFVGYSDILPIGQALRPWHAATIYEHDYFYPEETKPSK